MNACAQGILMGVWVNLSMSWSIRCSREVSIFLNSAIFVLKFSEKYLLQLAQQSSWEKVEQNTKVIIW